MQRRDFLRRISLFSLGAALPNLVAACTVQRSTGSSRPAASDRPLTVGAVSYPGILGHYIAFGKNFYTREGIQVNEEYLQTSTATNAALIAGRVELAWIAIPDLMTLIAEVPSLKILMVSDYSNGADGILGRNMNRATDLRGKKVAREDAPYSRILLGSYLRQAGMTEKDVEVLSLTASSAAIAFAAGEVDAATTHEPWLTKTAQEQAVKESNGRIIFTTQGTNIIATGLVARAETIASRRDDILNYLSAIDKALTFAKTNPKEANRICANKLGVTSTEFVAQLKRIRFYNIEDNKEGPLNESSPYSLIKSLDEGRQILSDSGLLSQPVDVASLIDDSLIKSL